MSSKHKPSPSRVLFLELVLDLVIFAICAIICLQVFAEARQEAQSSKAITQLGIQAQEIGERFKSGQDDPAELAVRTFAAREGNTLTWYFDQELNPVSSDKALFVLTGVIDDSQPVKTVALFLTKGSEELFRYEIGSYYPNAPKVGGDGS